MDWEKRLMLKMAREKFGKVNPQTQKRKIKTAEESFSASLSVLHDSQRNKFWSKAIKDLLKISGGGIY